MILDLVYGLKSGPWRALLDWGPKGTLNIEKKKGSVVGGRKQNASQNASLSEFRENLLRVTIGVPSKCTIVESKAIRA